ncbi:hypothetical protein MTR_0010s0130 [Medicago truncatula]|uniref:Uncharacterized protein n=1 Tax=Medicago truncatula TaxID=3880 RepID=A0A072TKW7_MEDTR|nr:hypothetical protein MTR_0010s0130 [Medicago truncatula]
MASSSSVSSIKINTYKSYVLKERTVTVPLNRLDVQVEAAVDFGSLERNGMDIKGYFAAQNMMDYFVMLNRLSYENLVKDFWVRAEVFDRKIAEEEEASVVKENPRLKGKSRTEMGLRPFKGTEIRSTVMGMEITITVETIAKACRCSNDGLFQVDAIKSQWEKKINGVLFKGNVKAKSSDLSPIHRMLKKILSECIFQKGGGTDSPSLDHKLVLYFLATFDRINLPKYILHHICWALRESQNNGRRQIPFGRLLSEIFVQGQLLKHLKNYGVSSDEELGTVVGKIINGKTLRSMYLVGEDNPEVLYQFIKAHFQNTGEIISYASIPDNMGRGPLKVKGKRTKNVEKDDVSAPKPKRDKTVKTEGSTASKYASDEVIQKKRIKKHEVRDASREAALREEVIQKKKDKKPLDIVSAMVEVTPEMAQRAKEVAADELAKQKRLAELYIKQRDDKLKAVGLAESGSLDAEIASLVAEVGKQTVKEATILLQENLMKGKGTSEAAASESASEAVRSDPHLLGNSTDPNAHINIQILSSSPSPSSSSSTDLDDIPLIIQALNVILLEPNPESQKASEVASTEVISEELQPQQPSSPSTLFSLEKHLGGEMSITPQKASETVHEKTVSENQQSSSSVIENEPEVHSELQN